MGALKYRKNIRLKDYDYKTNGYYFVTICANYRRPRLKIYEKVIEEELLKLPRRFNGLTIDWYKIMPDHIHCIFALEKSERPLSEIVGAFKSITTNVVAPLVGAKGPLAGAKGSLAGAMGRGEPSPFGTLDGKFSLTNLYSTPKELGKPCDYRGNFKLWQPNYYEHVVRDERALAKIREYIQSNPDAEKLDWNKIGHEKH